MVCRSPASVVVCSVLVTTMEDEVDEVALEIQRILDEEISSSGEDESSGCSGDMAVDTSVQVLREVAVGNRGSKSPAVDPTIVLDDSKVDNTIVIGSTETTIDVDMSVELEESSVREPGDEGGSGQEGSRNISLNSTKSLRGVDLGVGDPDSPPGESTPRQSTARPGAVVEGFDFDFSSGPIKMRGFTISLAGSRIGPSRRGHSNPAPRSAEKPEDAIPREEFPEPPRGRGRGRARARGRGRGRGRGKGRGRPPVSGAQ